jgi:hypothetical protein
MLYSVERDGKVLINGEQLTICDEAIVQQVKVSKLSLCSPEGHIGVAPLSFNLGTILR